MTEAGRTDVALSRAHDGKQASETPGAIADLQAGAGVRRARLLDATVDLQPGQCLLAARRPGVPELPGQAPGRGQGLIWLVPRGAAPPPQPNLSVGPSSFPMTWLTRS